MKSIKTKTKPKKNGGKFGRVKFAKDSSNTINADLSSLHKPIDISVSNLHQVIKLLEEGSEELKSILTYECDIIYECRMCRSLFRSLANFVSHKRAYCKDKYDITVNKHTLNDHEMIFTTYSTPKLSEPQQQICKENCKNDRILRSHVPKEERKKDLVSIIDMLQMKQKEIEMDYIDNGFKQESITENLVMSKNKQIFLEMMDSNNSAMYQTVESLILPAHTADFMKAQISEIQNIKNRNTAILGPNGQFIEQNHLDKGDSPMQIYGSDEENASMVDIISERNLMCSICNARFSTKKTLTFHMKTLHTSHRICYPCPCCPSTFVNTWSVYRHLFKVHRKSNDQVRKLRSEIQEKAFRKETTGAEDLERENASNKLQIEITKLQSSDETQEWMDHLESNELQRCGGCGKRFDRKAALSSHSQYCQRRIAARNEITTKTKKSKQLPEVIFDNNCTVDKTANNVIQNVIPEIVGEEKSLELDFSPMSFSPDINESNETSIRVQAVVSLSEADWDKIDSGQPLFESNETFSLPNLITSDHKELLPNFTPPNSVKELSPSSDLSDCPKVIYTNIEKSKTVTLCIGSKKRKMSFRGPEKRTVNVIEYHPTENNTNRITDKSISITPSDTQTTRIDHTLIMENKIATLANLRKLQCLPCKRKFTSMTNLRRHMAIHIGWNRYRCKLCDFKCFVKCDCVAHCNKVHNAQNNRAVIAEMVMQIPQEEYACNEDIVMDITNIEENMNESEVIDVTKTLENSEINASNENVNNTNINEINVCKPSIDIMLENEIIVPMEIVTTTDERHQNDIEINDENNKKEVNNTINDTINNIVNNTVNNIVNNAVNNIVNDTVIEVHSENNTEEVNDTVMDSNNDTINDEIVKEIKRENLNEDTDFNSSTERGETDEELRRMIMEVIFGPNDDESVVTLVSKEQLVAASKNTVHAGKKSQNIDENRIVPNEINDPKERNSLIQDEVKPQRPVRNRVKPLNKDFIYDLKEVAHRKESNTKGSGFSTGRAFNKKSFVHAPPQNNERNVKMQMNQSSNGSKSLSNDTVPLIIPYENIRDKFDVKSTSANLKSTFALSHMSQLEFVSQTEVTICGEK